MKNINPAYCLIMAILGLFSCKKDNGLSHGKGKDLELTAIQQQQVDADNKFSLKLFKNISDNAAAEKNLLFSPLSVSMALSMTSNGGNGETLTEMRAALEQTTFKEDDINSYYKKLISDLPALDPLANMKLANSIWYRNGLSALPAFLETNRNSYKATVEGIDFSKPAAKDKINGWVNDNTNGKIPKMLDDISGDIVMYLINTIYFKAGWKHKFDKGKTTKGTFYTSGNTPVQVDFMKGQVTCNAATFDKVNIYELPYGNDKYSMVILLPEQGKTITDIINAADTSTWKSWMSALAPLGVDMNMPKFKFACKVTLNDRLIALGMKSAFSPGADFTRMSAGGGIRISEVLHSAFIEVNEEGTEAAAATAVGGVVTSVPAGPPVITIDRPFIFVIREMKTGLILFNGIVRNPLLEN